MRNYNGKNVVVHYAELRCYYDPHCRYWSDWFIHNACHMANATVASSIGWLELLIMWLLFFVMNINVNSLHAFYLFYPRQMSTHCANWGLISWEITSQWKTHAVNLIGGHVFSNLYGWLGARISFWMMEWNIHPLLSREHMTYLLSITSLKH